jgi:dipeptide transport system substrate-binding protein
MRATASLVLLFAMALPAFASTLVFCSEASPQGFQPQFFTTNTTFDATSVPMFNRLVAFELTSTNVVSSLAESWVLSPDTKTLTFKLRRGVKFHGNAWFKPSRDFDADDVLFSWNRMADERNPFHKLPLGQSFAYYDDLGMKDIVGSVEKLDDYTVRFNLKRPEAAFLADMAMDFASILSREYFEAMAKKGTPEVADDAPIGTGPFEFVSYQKDSVIRYKAFNDYWGGRPRVDALVYAITRDATARYAKLRAGECNVTTLPKPADVPDMQKDPGLNVQRMEGLNIAYIAFNTRKKPLDNKLVRQALNMAVNKAAIVKSVYQDMAQVAKNPIPPSMWGYNDKVRDYEYDPAKARALLARAGFADGFAVDLSLPSVSYPFNPDSKRMAEMIQADWDKIGVKTRLVRFDTASYSRHLRAGEHMAAIVGWSGDNGDPDNFFTPLLSCAALNGGGGGNFARWCDSEFEALIVQAAQTPKQAERARLYEKAQLIVKEEAPWITVAHAVYYEPARKEVRNYKLDVFDHHNFSKVEIAK